MSNTNSMASSQPQPQAPRPPFPQQHPTFRNDFPAPNSRTNSFSAQSPPSMPYSSPSPQQFSAQHYGQPPAAKRPRLSPEIQSPFSPISYPPTPTGQAGSPGAAFSVNGTTPAPSRPGLMAPPQRPADKNPEDRNYDDILAGTGINIDEEARNLTRPDFYGSTPQSSFHGSSSAFQYQNNSFGRPGSSGSPYPSQNQLDGHSAEQPQLSTEEKQQREHARADWEAGRHTQHALWDMFLYGGDLNDKVRKISMNEHIYDPQSGVMVNTQKQGPPPTARVNGLEGASRVIDKGQAILDTGQKGERLSEVMKLICLATKSRLTGLLSVSSRVSTERRIHSKGLIPEEWADVAVAARAPPDQVEGTLTAAGGVSLKRTHSQANSENASQTDLVAGGVRITTSLQKAAQIERTAEESRRAKRVKRKAATNPDASTTVNTTDAATDAALAAALDPEKKTTKKERKLAESKFSEQQQHKSANEAARMAVSGLMGNIFGGKKSRTYDWMSKAGGGGGGGSAGGTPGLTPGRPSLSTNTSTAPTPATDRVRAQLKEKGVGAWDEDKDPGIQARDVLLVLETDARAPRAFVRGCSMLDS